MEWLLRYSFLVVIAVCIIFFSLWNPVFLSFGNQINILEGSAILLIVALGMTLVVAMGGIDLSVGIALDFGAAFAVVALKEYDAAWYVAILVGIAGGCLIGLLNAALTVWLNVSAFMATLGTFFIGSSLQRIFTNGGGPISHRRMPKEYRDLAVGDLASVPTEVVIAAVVLILYFIFLERSIFGKRLQAIGLQPTAALIAGIEVKRIMFIGFVIAGATCAIGGLIASANIRMFTPLSGFSYLLDAIAAVFIGASMHPRGRPNVLGTLVGVLFLGILANGLNLMGLNFNTKDALSGVILVGALAFAIGQKRLISL
ncbi:MAG: ABC transporter permease [Aestuariivita sp.]|nr:ABC transporter permease [Aestuariivita sp.]